MKWHASVAGIALGLQALGVFADQKPITETNKGHAPKNPLTEDFGRFASDLLKEWHVAGIAIGVIDGDDLFAQGYGIATLPDTEATPDTLWFVGSTTKAQTVATLARLIDSRENHVLADGWRTPISSIIRDDFVLQNEWSTAHITLEDAASHRTGFTRHDATMGVQPNSSDSSNDIIRQTVRNMRNLPLQLEPRVEFHYCNLMYVVLSHVIETVTEKWLGDVFKEQIWEPLGMKSTFLDPQQAQEAPEHLSTGYYWHKKDEEFKTMPNIPAGYSGAGAVISNVVDYSKWPFSAAVHKEIRKPRMVQRPEPDLGVDVVLYSLGWFRTNIHGQVAYYHSGSTGTHGTLVYWFPELDYGVVMFANSANQIREVLMRRLIEDKLDIPESERYDMDQAPTKDTLPSPLKTSDLAGKYRHRGYGVLELRETPHPAKEGETILVAGDDYELHHVTGNYWVMYIMEPIGPVAFYVAHFVIGADGEAIALAVDVFDRGEMVHEGTILYLRYM